MTRPLSLALFALCSAALLSACVPTGATAPLSASVPKEGIYNAVADNGLTVPAVDPAKVPDQFERQVVEYKTDEAPGTIIINPAEKHLYFVTGRNKAIRYGIAVGRAGFEWSGVANVTDRKNWPTWTPPPEMIARDPAKYSKWAKGQPGGLTNPLGARALYLTTNGRDYGYRIHGTPDWWSIGKNASSGCIRMINQDVIDLYNRVPDGAKVIVLTRSGEMPKGLTLPPPQAPKKPANPVIAPLQPLPLPTLTPQSVGVTAPAAAAPAVVEPAAAAPAAAQPAATQPAPATSPATVVCAQPLINGVCPKG